MAIHATKPHIVFIIDDNLARQHETKLIFDFMGEQSLIATPLTWQEHNINAEELLMILISDSSLEKQPQQFINTLKQRFPQKPLIMLTDKPQTHTMHADLMNIVAGIVQQPLRLDHVFQLISTCQTYKKQLHDAAKNQNRDKMLFRSLVGLSAKIQTVRKTLEEVVKQNKNTLIIGEAYTGKQVLARNIHFASKNKDKNFIHFDCSTANIDNIEKQLFGHQHFMDYFPGVLEEATSSTLFIDEIDLLPLRTQAKLLEAISDQKFQPVNSNKSLEFNARIIATTSQNIETLIQRGLFREELYYCLNNFLIEMPALRDRIDDLPLLLNELIARLEATQKTTLHFAGDTISLLRDYVWPNNLQELSDLVDYCALHYPNDIISPEKLPAKFHKKDKEGEGTAKSRLPDPNIIRLPETGVNLKAYLAETEISIIKQALQHCNGVVARAAKHLDMRRTTLLEKMRRYQLR